jgi:hypothetical protein
MNAFGSMKSIIDLVAHFKKTLKTVVSKVF